MSFTLKQQIEALELLNEIPKLTACIRVAADALEFYGECLDDAYAARARAAVDEMERILCPEVI